jgi:CRP-like cAMP-binding protein
MPAATKNHFLLQLSAQDRSELLDQTTPHQLKVGDILCEAGDQLDTVYFLESGAVSVIKLMADGRGVETRTIGRESAFGLLHAEGSRVCLCRVIVQLAGEASQIKAERLARLMEQSPSLRRAAIRHAQLTAAQAEQSVACNLLHSIEQRLARWLLMSQDRTDGGPLNLTHEFIALMLGVQRTSVTVSARRLQRLRIIDYSRGRVTIVDREALKQIACECYGAYRNDSALLVETA